METHNDNHVKTLNELADEEVKRQIPLMVYLIVLCLSGIIGNCLVCYVCAKKYTPSTFRIFVIVLAAVDLFTCGVVIPLELLQFAWQYTYDNVQACKFNMFVKPWATITSGFLLLCIAIDRYRKVCRPFGVQISLQVSRYMCMGSALLGVAFSWISPVIYSVKTKELKVHNLTISECAITEPMKKSVYPLFNNVGFVFLFVGALTGIVILYGFIAVRVKQQMKKKIGSVNRSEKRKSPAQDNPSYRISYNRKSSLEVIECNTSTSGNSLDFTSTNHSRETNMDKTEMDEIKTHSVTKSDTKRIPIKRSKQKNKTTLIMFMISLAFIISYLPLLCLILITFIDKTFAASLTDTERAGYKFAYRSYLLNCAINPVIYGIWDARFRKYCKMLFECRKK